MLSGYYGKLRRWGKIFKSDGFTSVKRTYFDFTTGKELRPTNEDRVQLLTLFSARKAKNKGYAFIVAGIVLTMIVISIVFATAANDEDTSFAAWIAIPFMIPAVCLIGYGIYSIVTVPNRENAVIRMFEFEVQHLHIIERSRYTRSITVHNLDEIPEFLSMTCVSDPYLDVILDIGGNLVELCSEESVAAVRNGAKAGDKVRLAILDNGKKILVTVYR